MSILGCNIFLKQTMPFEVAEEDTYKGLEDLILQYLNDFGEYDKPKAKITELSKQRIKIEFYYFEEKIGQVLITQKNNSDLQFIATLDECFEVAKHLINERDETERNYEQAENESWKQQRNYEALLWNRR